MLTAQPGTSQVTGHKSDCFRQYQRPSLATAVELSAIAVNGLQVTPAIRTTLSAASLPQVQPSVPGIAITGPAAALQPTLASVLAAAATDSAASLPQEQPSVPGIATTGPHAAALQPTLPSVLEAAATRLSSPSVVDHQALLAALGAINAASLQAISHLFTL